MDSTTRYKFWLENPMFDQATRDELIAIQDKPSEIEERFYRDLEFGTAGLRGIIGAGTNRMNVYTVRKASQGVAEYLKSQGRETAARGIVIAYDSRHKSPEFAEEAARVFAANNIPVYLFDELRPVPMLSFAVRQLRAAAGIVVTASHNPREYNGYKVYGSDGAQLSVEGSRKVLEAISRLEDLTRIPLMERREAEQSGLLKIIGPEIDEAYTTVLEKLSLNPEGIKRMADRFGVVYTPLHGTGNKPVRRILKEIGLKRVLVVKEQELPDPDFSTVRTPNPEEKDALTMGIRLATDEDVDLVIGTDPDCDRMGLAVRIPSGDYTVLNGNQTGCLMLDYILSRKQKDGTLPQGAFVVKTIVTTEMARAIAASYSVEMVEVLTGFKFIGEKILQLDERGNQHFLFGFEESFGCLAGTHARDKDGVVAAMLAAEMAVFYKEQGMTLYDGLQELYRKYGYYLDDVNSFALSGKEGLEKIQSAMKTLRREGAECFAHIGITAIRDYLDGTRTETSSGKTEILVLPASDVLYFETRDGSWFCVRPSGTEPKIKIYYGVSAAEAAAAEEKLRTLQTGVLQKVKVMLEST